MTHQQKLDRIDEALRLYLPEQNQIDQLRKLLEEVRSRTSYLKLRNYYHPKTK